MISRKDKVQAWLIMVPVVAALWYVCYGVQRAFMAAFGILG